MRYDIISDTHGYLSDQLLRTLDGADIIVHAGDICSLSDYLTLTQIAEVHACLGNNDWGYDYGPDVGQHHSFFSEGLRWQVCHYIDRLDFTTCEVGISGHTHKPKIELVNFRGKRMSNYNSERPLQPGVVRGLLSINPGSPSLPRAVGTSLVRVHAQDGIIQSAELIVLPR